MTFFLLSVSNQLLKEGAILLFVGMLVVFTALLLLNYCFKAIPIVINFFTRRRLQQQGKMSEAAEVELNVPAAVSVAISTALHLYFAEQHDFEETTITIKKAPKNYSPWSSKLYGMNNVNVLK